MSSKSTRSELRRPLALAGSLLTIALAFTAPARLGAQRLPGDDDTQRFYADDPIWRDDDQRHIAPVASFDLSKSYEFVRETFGDTVKSRGRALNVNTLDEVPDSSWFTNRLGRHDMTIDEVLRGPNQVDGPADGMWHVTGRPDSGITPKFTIKDARGDTYLIKLDPAAFPELPSSVELISTKIFHAIGYHVPEDFIVTFDQSRLDVAPGAKIRTDSGAKRAIDMKDVRRWLANTPRTADGRIRALASRYVPGRVVGQFRFTGTRPDDANDIYPHERRRELRGMRVFAAWLNHDDARSINSIDTYVTENGRGYIRHYLQDFGSNLGSGSTSAQQPRGGYEYLIEGDKIARGLATFGFWRRDWTRVDYPDNPSLGNIESEFFEPWRWKTEYPQPAFGQMDAADGFWAASIASRFSDDMLRAIVDAGQLSDRDAARYLTAALIERRNKVVAYWMTRTNPLDRFAIERSGRGTELTFDNAAVRLGLATARGEYMVRWTSLDNASGTEAPAGAERTINGSRLVVPADAWGTRDQAGDRYAMASIKTIDPAYAWWSNPVVITLRERNGLVTVVGIRRPDGATNPVRNAATR